MGVSIERNVRKGDSIEQTESGEGKEPGEASPVLQKKILIVDAFTLYREAIAAYLAVEADLDIHQSAALNQPAPGIAAAAPFDLVLLRLDARDPLETAMRRVATVAGDHARLALLGGHLTPNGFEDALAAGVVGHIPVTLPSAQLAHVLRLMIAGGIFTPPASNETESATPDLKQRDLQVLSWLADGATNKEIAAQLKLQEVTVKVIIGRLLRRFGARNRAQLVGVVRARRLI